MLLHINGKFTMVKLKSSLLLEIKDITDTDRSASYLDLQLEIDSEGWLRMNIFDKRNYFNFPIVTFSCIKFASYK
jgi:hypothetical protein